MMHTDFLFLGFSILIIRFNFSEGYFILITELLLMRTDVLNYTAFKLGLEMVDNLSSYI